MCLNPTCKDNKYATQLEIGQYKFTDPFVPVTILLLTLMPLSPPRLTTNLVAGACVSSSILMRVLPPFPSEWPALAQFRSDLREGMERSLTSQPLEHFS